MAALTVAPARTEDEVEAALRMAIPIFEAASGMGDYATYKTLLWREDPAFRPGSLLLARLADGAPIGLVRLVPRTIYRGDQTYRVAGISSVCLVPEQRGKGLSVSLMEQALAHCRREGFDFAFLFARRAADHYYTRFGFWGVASYSRLAIRYPTANAVPLDVSLQPADEAYIGLYSDAYRRCYAACFGRTERSDAYWRFIIRRLSYFKELRFCTLVIGSTPSGYVIYDSEAVHELAYVRISDVGALLASLGKHLRTPQTGGSVTLNLSPDHALVAGAYGVDITLSARECTYGGHMASILRPGRLLERIAARSPSAAKALAPLGDRSRFSHRDTCRLLGAWSPTETESFGDVPMAFNVSFPDHF